MNRTLKSTLQWIRNHVSDSSRIGKIANRRPTTQRLNYDAFEARQLLAGIVFFEATGEVQIGGTNADDTARVTQTGSTVTVTQEGFPTETFSASEVNFISFIGLRGDDFFENRTSIDSFAFGQVGNDTLIGGSGNDRLIGNGEEDILIGNAGDDVIVAGIGDDQIDAGDGNDRVIGVNGSNTILGGLGDDEIFGGIGDDTITDEGGENLLVGAAGNDNITGSNDADNIFGGPGNDLIFGSGGDDIIYAQAGDDTISGGAGEDIIGGNDGNDTFQGEQGDDRLVGGPGLDRANFSGSFFSYDIAQSGPNFLIDDLRGPNFGLTDFVIGTEEFQFGDGLRTDDELRNPPPIREIVTVQPIVASNSDGSNTAEFFGNAEQEQEIKNRIDAIFAQAQVDVEFLPVRTVNNTFVNVGDSNGARPRSDLNRIVSNGDDAGIGHPDRNVIDLYFVETVPGFDNLGESVANGLAFVGASGIGIHIGDNLVNSSNGRAVAARVAAHEIGHNLGLAHEDGSDNLLSETGNSTFLTPTQINAVLASPISRPG